MSDHQFPGSGRRLGHGSNTILTTEDKVIPKERETKQISNEITQGQGSRAAPAQDEGSNNVSGTKDAMNAEDENTEIQTTQDAIINLGYGAGNSNLSSDGNQNLPDGCSGTQNAFNAKKGSKIILSGNINSGAFSGTTNNNNNRLIPPTTNNNNKSEVGSGAFSGGGTN